MSLPLILLKIYLPILLLILIPIIIFRTKRITNNIINIDVLNIIQIPFPLSINFPIKGIHIKWALLSVFVLSVCFYYINLDFSKFFPQRIEMTVHFNEKNGIERLLMELGIDEINGMKIVNDPIETNNFFSEADMRIEKYLDYKDYFTTAVLLHENIIETQGNTLFIVEKVGGIQNYKISSSEGVLIHTKKVKDKNDEKLTTKFQKVISQNDKISINNLSDILDKIIISPKFSQSLVINGRNEERLEQYLYGVTIIKSFPYPTFTSTLFLFQNKGKLVPIGYAEYYRPKD